jgi:hypothetical protein
MEQTTYKTDGGINWSLKKGGRMVWTGVIWLRMGIRAGLF